MSPEFRMLLAATDFSEAGEAAGRFAGTLAAALGAELRCLHVVEPLPAPPDPAGGMLTADLSLLQATLDARTSELSAFAARHTPPGAEPGYEVPQGPPTTVIPEYAAAAGASAIVLGLHGHSLLNRLVFGSVADAVIRKADRPVITVRSDGDLPPAGGPVHPLVLVATHFSPACAAAADWGVALAARLKARLEFLHVAEIAPETFYHGETRGERNELPEPVTPEDYWQGRLEEFARARVAADQPWRARVEPGRPEERIAAAATADSPGILCIGTHRRGALSQLLGSTASHLIRQVRCPVLTVKA